MVPLGLGKWCAIYVKNVNELRAKNEKHRSTLSKVVIHLCSCLLSVVSVLEVQDGNTQAWAAGELLDSGPKQERLRKAL